MRFIEFLEKTFSKSPFNVKKRAQYDFNTLKFNSNDNFAILSVDLQKSTMAKIKNNKLSILIQYHRELQEICKKNNVPFILTSYNDSERDEEHLLKDDFNLRYVKDQPSALQDGQINRFLKRENITSVYVIGIIRTVCIFATLQDLVKLNYSTYTSIIGTAAHKNFFTYLNDKNIISSKKDRILESYSNQDITKFGIKNELQLFKKIGVKILDYKD